MGFRGSRYANKVAKEYDETDLGLSGTTTVLQDNGEFQFRFIPITEYSVMQWVFDAQLDPGGSGSPFIFPFAVNRAKDSHGVSLDALTAIAPNTTGIFNTFVPTIGSITTTTKRVFLTYYLKGQSQVGSFGPGSYLEVNIENTVASTNAPMPCVSAALMNLGLLNPHTDRDLFITNPRVILFD